MEDFFLFGNFQKSENIENIIKNISKCNDNYIDYFLSDINNSIYFICKEDFDEKNEFKIKISFTEIIDIKFDFFSTPNSNLKLLLSKNEIYARLNINNKICKNIEDNHELVICVQSLKCKKGDIIGGLINMIFLTKNYETRKININELLSIIKK
jgi:hypothetical protein